MPSSTTVADKPHQEPTEADVVEEASAIYPSTESGGPSADEIAEEAYKIYLGRGGEHGRDMEDWLEAERRLTPARVRK
jgi:hypothetical protein